MLLLVIISLKTVWATVPGLMAEQRVIATDSAEVHVQLPGEKWVLFVNTV